MGKFLAKVLYDDLGAMCYRCGLYRIPRGGAVLSMGGQALWDFGNFIFRPKCSKLSFEQSWEIEELLFKRECGTNRCLGLAVWANISFVEGLQGLGTCSKHLASKTLPVLLPQRVIEEWWYSEARLAQITARAVGRQNGVSWLSLFVCTMDIKQRRLVKCLLCQEEYTYFKLFRSYREELLEWIEIAFKGDQGPALLCADCEVKERLKEIERWTKKGRIMKAFPMMARSVMYDDLI